MTRSATRLWGALGISLLTAGLCADRPASRLRGHQPQIPLASTGPTGTGVIAGRVVDPTTNAPIANAIVTLIEIEAPRDAVTQRQRVMADGDGRFAFSGLPKGRFTLRANLPGYIDGSYRQRRPSSGGEPVELADGEKRVDLTLPLWKAAVISGRVVDEAGEPMIGVGVRVLRRTFDGGVARLAAFGAPQTMTDDRGVYRFAQLPPGQYVVAIASTATTFPASFMPLNSGPADEHREQVFAAINEFAPLGSDRNQQIGDRVLMTQSSQPQPPPPTDGAVGMYPLTFFPGTSQAGEAAVLTLPAGAERTDVNFSLAPVRTVRVSGRLLGADAPAANTAVRVYDVGQSMLDAMNAFATATGLTDGAGHFVLLGVPPGQYVIRADVPQRLPVFLRAAEKPLLSAAERITVGATDVRDLTLQLRLDTAVSGRVEFQTTPPRTGNRLANLTVAIESVDRPDIRSLTATKPDGTFSTFVPAGRYVLRTEDLDDAWLTSVTVDGRDALEEGFDVGAAAVENVVFTLSDKTTKIAGLVRDGENNIAVDGAVVVFPVSTDLRLAQGAFPKRMPAVRVSRDGRYTIRGLLPGDYFVIAIDAAFTDNWQSPESLENLSRLATRITIGANEDRALDLRVVEVRR